MTEFPNAEEEWSVAGEGGESRAPLPSPNSPNSFVKGAAPPSPSHATSIEDEMAWFRDVVLPAEEAARWRLLKDEESICRTVVQKQQRQSWAKLRAAFSARLAALTTSDRGSRRPQHSRRRSTEARGGVVDRRRRGDLGGDGGGGDWRDRIIVVLTILLLLCILLLLRKRRLS